MNARIERFPDMRVAFVRHVGPYAACGDAWESLLPRLGAEGWLAGDVRMIGLCWDDPEVTAPAQVRYDACVTVDPSFTERDGIGIQTIAGGDYAIATHTGPWSEVGRTYVDLVGRWLPQSGRELRGEPSLEIYLNDPASTSAEDLLTDICVPLAPTRRA